MKGLLFRSVGAVIGLSCLMAALSCARDQQLVSITIKPDTENFGVADPSLNVQLRALGTYVHPPVTKDITDQVTWASNTPQMITVNSTGLIAPGGFACGSTLVSATVTTNHSGGDRPSSGALVTGYMTANVACLSSSGPVLTLNFAGLGAGIVTSSPAGLSCASTAGTCSAGFVSGTTITLTATPTAPSTFGGWGNCPSPSGLVCTIPSFTTSTAITATFN